MSTDVVPTRARAAWASRAGNVAIVLLVGQLLWRGAYLVRGYYTQDDYRMLRLGGESPMSVDYLFQAYSGHLWPGGFVIAWVTARVDPMSWTLTAGFLLLLQLGSGVVMWLILSRMLGESWRRVPILAVFLFSPLTLWSLQWWAQAIGYLPVTLCLLFAVWSLMRRIQDDSVWGSALAVFFTALAMTFQERALLIPLVLGGVALIFSDVEGPARRVGRAIADYRGLWAAMAALSVGYVLLHSELAPIDAAAPNAESGGPLTLASDFILRTLIPGMVGGPWDAEIISGTFLVPGVIPVVVALVLFVPFVLLTLLKGGGSARWGWATLAVYTFCDVAILYGGRTQYDVDFGLLPRYVADVIPVATIILAAAVRTLPSVPMLDPKRRSTRWRWPAFGALALTAVYICSAAVTTTMMAPHQLNKDDRAYVDNLRADLQENPQTVIYDMLVPDGVMIGWFGEERRVSTVLARAPEHPVYDIPTRAMMIPDEAGKLRPITLAFKTSMKGTGPANDCGYSVDASGATIPLNERVDVDRYVMRLGYYTNVDTTMVVTVDGTSQKVPVAAGLNAADLVVTGSFDEVRMRLDTSPGAVCVATLDLGFPQPSL